MDPYFPIIFTQNVILCIVASCFVRRNSVLQKKEKIVFYLSLAMGLMIAVCEYVYTATNGKVEYIWLQNIANYTSLAFAPILPAIPVLTISKTRVSHVICLIPVGINLAFLVTGQLFSIDEMGNYSRAPLFFVFIVSYLANMVYLTYESLLFSIRHQNHNAAGLLFISLFMISSTTIQLRHPQIHFSWFCVTVTALLYFLYYTDVVQQMDTLTGLLNRTSFWDFSARHRKSIFGVVMIDFDDFKMINDTYGHLVGDQYLRAFGDCLRRNFQNGGNCYRLGGDEFCVLLTRKPESFPLGQTMKALDVCCRNVEGLPVPFTFSYGYQKLDEPMTIEEAMELADRSMYEAKQNKKKAIYQEKIHSQI